MMAIYNLITTVIRVWGYELLHIGIDVDGLHGGIQPLNNGQVQARIFQFLFH